MSNRTYIKGQKRRAARHGLGRLVGNVGALFEAEERQAAKNAATDRKNIQKLRAKHKSDLDRMAEQDQKRTQRFRAGARRSA